MNNAARIALRVLLYIVWLGVWMILFRQYEVFRAIFCFMASGVLTVLLFAALIYGFIFITRKTRAACNPATDKGMVDGK